MSKKLKQKTSTSDPACAAMVGTSAIGMSAIAMYRYADVVGQQEPEELIEQLKTRVEAVQQGDMSGVEGMLMAQAISLQSIYANFSLRAADVASENPGAAEIYLRLALRAQSQCRATLETLASIKRPAVVYAQQANVTTGPQQINNGVPAGISSEQNQFLEDQHGERLDTRAQGAAVGSDSTLEAVGARHRAKDGRG